MKQAASNTTLPQQRRNTISFQIFHRMRNFQDLISTAEVSLTMSAVWHNALSQVEQFHNFDSFFCAQVLILKTDLVTMWSKPAIIQTERIKPRKALCVCVKHVKANLKWKIWKQSLTFSALGEISRRVKICKQKNAVCSSEEVPRKQFLALQCASLSCCINHC